MRYKIEELESGRVFEWTLSDILNEINRDRSNQWTPYDKTDWRDGWENWVEGDYYKLLNGTLPPQVPSLGRFFPTNGSLAWSAFTNGSLAYKERIKI